VSGQLRSPAALPPGKEPPVPIGFEAGWAPEPVWTTWRKDKSCSYRDSNSDPSVVQPVASRCIMRSFLICTCQTFLRYKSRINRRVCHVERIGDERDAYKILVRIPGGKRRWENNIKMDLKNGMWRYGLHKFTKNWVDTVYLVPERVIMRKLIPVP
jgi:hypothetical protein